MGVNSKADDNNSLFHTWEYMVYGNCLLSINPTCDTEHSFLPYTNKQFVPCTLGQK